MAVRQNLFPAQAGNGLACLGRVRSGGVLFLIVIKRFFPLPFHPHFPEAEIVRRLHLQFNAGVFQHVAVILPSSQVNGRLLVLNGFQAYPHRLGGRKAVAVRPGEFYFPGVFFQADIRNDNAAPFHAERLTLRVRRGCQVLGGSHLQRQRGAFRGGNDACAHGLLPVGARHIGGVGHGGRSAQQGGAGLRNDFQPPHDVPREKLQPVRLLHGRNVDFIHAVRQGGLLAHPVAEEILCRLRAGLGGVRQFELIQVAFPQGNDQGIRRRVQLGERIAFRRIERLEPAFQGVPRRFRAHQAYACRA